MDILVNVQRIGRRMEAVKPVPLHLDGEPTDVRSLIALCVEACLTERKRRASRRALPGDEQFAAMERLGKFAFSLEDGRLPSPETAVQTALDAFQDGVVRLFFNGEPILSLDDEIHLKPQDTVTFVRLTMLTGGGIFV